MCTIIPNDALAVTARTSARADRAVTIISGRTPRPVEASGSSTVDGGKVRAT